MRLRYKVWLEHDKKGKCFGDGPLEMLERIDRAGSLSQAAAEMGMSYSHAWHLIRRLERALGFALLERHTGGSQGGGSIVTPEARSLMLNYRNFRLEAGKILETLYEKMFRDFDWPE